MNKIVLIILGALVLIIGSLQAYQLTRSGNTAYVELGRIYNEFQLKKEMEAKLNSITGMRKNILDSLELNLKIKARELEALKTKDIIKERDFVLKREEFLMKKQQFEEDNENLTRQYQEQILKQMNQYVKDYGKENGFEYILGAEGTGAIMYANEMNNISPEVIKYINNRYKGSSK